MIQNNFNSYLERAQIIKQAEELKFSLQTELGYTEGFFDLFGVSNFFKNVKFSIRVENFKSEVLNNIWNLVAAGNTGRLISNLLGNFEKFITKLRNDKDLDPQIGNAVEEYVSQLFEYYIRKVVLKEEKVNRENLENGEVAEIDQKVKEAPNLPLETNDIEQINQILNSANALVQQNDGDFTQGGGTSELPEDIHNLVLKYIRGNASGRPQELIKQLVALSRDPKVRASGNTVRGIINILNAIILLTRKAANSQEDQALIRKEVAKLIRGLRLPLIKQNDLIQPTK